MRKIFAVCFFFMFIFYGAQAVPNRFSENENDSYNNRSVEKFNDQNGDEHTINGSASSDPNPGDPIPIDNYVIFLITAAVVLIIFKTYKKDPIISNNS